MLWVIRWLFLVVGMGLLFGCTTAKKQEPSPPAAFLFISTHAGDTYESLARTHLGEAKLAWLIREANGNKPIRPDQPLIVPLKPWRPGGLTARGYQLVTVLCYHHFSQTSRRKLTTTATDFESQLQYLRDNGYTVVSLDDFLQFLDFGALPKKSVLISIDDGWRSAYTVAYPLLRRYSVPTTLFIPVRYINAPSKRTMNWDMIREMISDTTVDIQSHTKTHKDLTQWPEGMSLARYLREVDREIEGGHRAILKETGIDSHSMAYPFGRTNDVIIGVLKKRGYRAGFTVERGGNAFFEDRFMLKRSMIFGDFSLPRFADELVTFQDYRLEALEPIDSVESLQEIADTDPDQYETKHQWRTALLAWRLYRDRWLERADRVAQAESRISALEKKLRQQAKTYYQQARNTEDPEERRRNVLLALLYHPQDKRPLDLLQSGQSHLISYRVKDGETLRKIALRFYHDPSFEVLIRTLNPQITTAGTPPVGTELVLPRNTGLKRSEGTESISRCGMSLTKSATATAQELYDEAVDFFSQDKIPEAIGLLKKAVCLQPDHKSARQLLDMLQKL